MIKLIIIHKTTPPFVLEYAYVHIYPRKRRLSWFLFAYNRLDIIFYKYTNHCSRCPCSVAGRAAMPFILSNLAGAFPLDAVF